jgi:hypothetical protein
MQNKTVDLPSGAKLFVSQIPFGDAIALFRAVVKSNKEEMKETTEISAILSSMSLLTSKEVEACVSKCLERCKYNDVRITQDLFDSQDFGEKLRGDYLPIFFAVIGEVCNPFFLQSSSGSKTQQLSTGVSHQ